MGMISFGRRRKTPGAAALHDALELRRRYGADAEQWCETGLLGAHDEAKRRALEEIRLALRKTPAT
jgi:hypothetical protein